MRTRILIGVAVMMLMGVLPAAAATISGVVTDTSGAAMPGTRVVLRDVATRQEFVVETGPDGRFSIEAPTTGTYLISVTRVGFSEAAQTLVIDDLEQKLEVPLSLEVGSLATAVVGDRVARRARDEADSAARGHHLEGGHRADQPALHRRRADDGRQHHAGGQRPVRRAAASARPGLDASAGARGRRAPEHRAAGDRSHRRGSGPHVARRHQPHGSRQRRGHAAVRIGRPGRHHQHHHQRADVHADQRQFLYGFNGFYSSNENGMRGTGTIGVTAPRYAVRIQAGAEDFDNYKAGDLDVEDTRPFFDVRRAATRRTPSTTTSASPSARSPIRSTRPTCAPTTRCSTRRRKGNFVNASSLVKLGDRRSVRVRYQRRRMEDVGFPDFAEPYFFNATSLPHSNLDRVSARYEAQAVTPWLANLSLTAYYQRTERLLQNLLPVQFPAPTPRRSSRSACSGSTCCPRPSSACGRRASTSRPCSCRRRTTC